MEALPKTIEFFGLSYFVSNQKGKQGKMKINIWFVIACVLVFCVGYNMNDVAVSFPKYKVAVIDVAQVLENSNEIQELKRAQDKDMEELNNIIT